MLQLSPPFHAPCIEGTFLPIITNQKRRQANKRNARHKKGKPKIIHRRIKERKPNFLLLKMSGSPSENDNGPSFEVISLPPSPDFSDGDRDVWPREAYWRQVDDWLYRHKLAMMWMQKSNKFVKGIYLFHSFIFSV